MTDPVLQDSGQALLNDYFNDLLTEPALQVVVAEQTATAEAETAHETGENAPVNNAETVAETEVSASETATPGIQAGAPETQADAMPREEVPAAPTVVARPALSSAFPPTLEHWQEADRHDCLLLQLAGITLAMPLCCADLPKPWPEGVQTLEAGLFQGLYQQEQTQRVVVHLAELVMPGKGIPQREGIVVPMLELPWSLRVDDLQGTRSYSAEQINWNRHAGKRPWLAGMVKGQPVALLNPLELARQLFQAWES